MAERFRVNEPTISFEEIKGEVVLINFENGHYHALNTSGAEVFEALIKGHSVPAVVDALEQRYRSQDGEIAAAVDGFVGLLHRYGIIAPYSSEEPVAGGPVLGSADGDSTASFEPPALESYDDMEQFLLVAPSRASQPTESSAKPG